MIGKMTTNDYAAKRKITLTAVCKAIRKNHRLPGVERVEKWGRGYILHVDKKKLQKYLEVQ